MLTVKSVEITDENINNLLNTIGKELFSLLRISVSYPTRIIFNNNHFEYSGRINIAEFKAIGILNNKKQDVIYEYFEIKVKSKGYEKICAGEREEYFPIDLEYILENTKIVSTKIYELIKKFEKIYYLFNKSKFSNYKCEINIDNDSLRIYVFEKNGDSDTLLAAYEF